MSSPANVFLSKAKYWIILAIPFVLVVVFYTYLKFQDETRIDNYFGTFGDSFGVLTCLFSGLAFAGMIITLLMQREELSLQREELELTRGEISKGNKTQEAIARINAISVIISSYNLRLADIESKFSKSGQNARELQTEKNNIQNKIVTFSKELEELLEKNKLTSVDSSPSP